MKEVIAHIAEGSDVILDSVYVICDEYDSFRIAFEQGNFSDALKHLVRIETISEGITKMSRVLMDYPIDGLLLQRPHSSSPD